jgi:uracil-DNA glycosylase
MLSDKLKQQLGDWEILYPFFEGPEWPKIKEALKGDLEQITPDMSVWFRAFKECKYSELKVVWLGLSPYYTKDLYTKANTADGLAFSTDTKHSVPPSLFKIYKGIEADLWDRMNLNMDRKNDLTFLANQGVLLLNSALTTVYGNSEAHLEIWKPFIEYLIQVLNKQNEGIIFCGFGKVANALLTKVDRTKHTVYEREHLAASAYASRDWAHEKLFSKINNKTTILWDNYLVDLEVPF